MMVLEMAELSRPVRPDQSSTPVRERLLQFLERQTRQRFGDNFEEWRRWIWKRPYQPHPDLVAFKGLLYANIDPACASSSRRSVHDPADEVDGRQGERHPPPGTRRPSMKSAGYLRDDHIVFGVAVGREARAYPKRILAWHELARDRVGGVELTVVYCTLCGTVIPYDSMVGGRLRTLGTSGLLYRSNKLMFDEETKSLWSTLEGKPVVGSLVGQGLELRPRSVVTTTWGEWRRLHSETTVLSRRRGTRATTRRAPPTGTTSTPIA
jgi:hypothetical protein